MRIFYASGERPNQALRDSQVWRNNLYGSLVDLGHDVVELDYDLNPLLAHADVSIPANRAFVDAERPRAEAALLSQLEHAHRAARVDLFFSYFYSVCARPETIRGIGARGIRTMNWYCNGSYQFHLVEEIAPAYDWSLVPEAFRMDDYRRVGAHPIYCQEAANPLVYHPVDVPRDLDVVFVGARYGERPQYIRRLVDAGIDVHVFGPGWQPRHAAPRSWPNGGEPGQAARAAPKGRIGRLRLLATAEGWRRLGRRLRRLFRRDGRRATGSGSGVRPATGTVDGDGAVGAARRGAAASRPADLTALPAEVCGPILSDDEMVEMYSRARISLGFSGVGNFAGGPDRIVQVRLRDFEAPMSGAFYMVEEMPELGDFFLIGEEVVCYGGPDDLVEKCRHYLAHPNERERIRLAGRARALKDHTWQRRLTDAFQEAGLEPTGAAAR